MSKKILIVDDDKAMRDLYARLLHGEYELALAASGEEALEKIETFAPKLVLLDIEMPGIDGYEVLERMKSTRSGTGIHVTMVSGKSSREDQQRAFEAGADDYMVKPIDPCEMTSRVRLHFRLHDAVGRVTTIESEIESRNRYIEQMAEEQARELISTQDVAVFTLASLAEARDEGTGQHLVRMRSYSQLLAESLQEEGPYASQINARFLDDLFRSSPLHDVGKVAISDAILLKPGRLTKEEFETIKQHTTIGANILDQAVFHSRGGGFLSMGALIARFHHEWFDGTGYPAGLAGDEIPLPARIVALADVFDALTSVRPYKPAFSPFKARRMIEEESGTHFDPLIVKAFRARFDDFLAVHGQFDTPTRETVGAMSFVEHECAELAGSCP